MISTKWFYRLINYISIQYTKIYLNIFCGNIKSNVLNWVRMQKNQDEYINAISWIDIAFPSLIPSQSFIYHYYCDRWGKQKSEMLTWKNEIFCLSSDTGLLALNWQHIIQHAFQVTIGPWNCKSSDFFRNIANLEIAL